jgi:hypothetical protein
VKPANKCVGVADCFGEIEKPSIISCSWKGVSCIFGMLCNCSKFILFWCNSGFYHKSLSEGGDVQKARRQMIVPTREKKTSVS